MMLAFIMTPLGRYAAFGLLALAVLAAGALWLHSIRQDGIEQGRTEAAAVGEARQADANKAARAVDDAVARTADPMAELKAKGWVVNDAP